MKPLLTCRATMIEAYRFFQYCNSERTESYNTEDKLIATLQGVYKANDKANFGTAGHLIIEKPRENRKVLSCGRWGYHIGPFELITEQVMPVLDYYQAHPQMVREIEVAKLYELPTCDLIVTGHVDGLEGNMIHDNKFKFSNFDVGEYADSYQHRLYLDMLGMRLFSYDFFRVHNFDTVKDTPNAIINPVESMLVTAYEGMEQDIYSLLCEFVEYVQFRQLQPFLAITQPKYKKIMAGNPVLKSIIQQRY
jgi:hypothetical protein